MAEQENSQACNEVDGIRLDEHGLEHIEVACPNAGTLNVYVQGMRSKIEVVILTVHDLGCNHTQYLEFVSHPMMQRIRGRTVWVHVDVPGQSPDAQDLPAGFTFPTMQKIGEDLICVLDQLNIKEVVCFGEGAGANILARFAMAHIDRVLGVCLLHCTGTTAGFMESIKDKFNKAEDKDQLKSAIENYQANLRTRTNPRNLRKFVEAFLKRTNIADNIKKLTCRVLLVTGQKNVFSSTTHNLHQAIQKVAQDKGNVEFIQVADVANILEERPEKMVESFQYFLQGLGLISSIPMHHVGSHPTRMRSMSMEEADQPRLRRSLSQGSGGAGSPISTSPPTGDPIPQQVVN